MRPLDVRKVVAAALAVAMMGLFAWGQDQDGDQAKALLQKGLAEYKAKQFPQAQATLLSVARDKLAAAQQKELDTYLENVRTAAKKYAEAMASNDEAETAMKAGQFRKAAGLFDQVGKSEYVPDEVKRQAQTNRALANRKAGSTKADPETPAPVVKPATQPAAGAAASAEPPTPAPGVAQTPAVADPATAGPSVGATPATPATQSAVVDATTQPAGGGGIDADKLARFSKANALLEQGNKQLDAGNADRALALFQEAVKIAPDYEPARQAVETAEALSPRAEGLTAISELSRQMRVKREQTEVLYNEALKKAREAIQAPKAADDFDQAHQQVSYAQTLINVNRMLYSDPEYKARKIELEELSRFVDAQRARWEQQHVAKQQQAMASRELERKAESERQRRERVAAMKDQIRQLRKQQKYRQAVEMADKLLQIAPEDEWAKETREFLSQLDMLRQDKAVWQTAMEQETKQFLGAREAAIPWYELLRYPGDWPEITLRRSGAGAEAESVSEADRIVRRKLEQVQKKLEFTGSPLEQVIEFIREISGTSIHVKWAALEQAGVNKDTAVNVKLTDVTIDKALRTILEDVGGVNPLSYVINDGVITISTRDDLSKVAATNVYDIRDLILVVPDFAAPSTSIMTGTGCSTTGSCGSSGGGFGGWGGNASNCSSCGSGNNGNNNTISRQQMVDNILTLVRDSIDPNSWVERSGTMSIRELNGQVIVTQTAENHRALLGLLAQLREARALQINVEARFIEVSTGFLNRIGIDLDFYFNLSTRLKPVATATGTWAVDPITGARIVNGATPTAYLAQWQGEGSPQNNLTPQAVHFGSFEFTTPAQTSVPGSIAGTASGSAMTFAGTFLDDVQVDFLVNATQANQNTRSLTAPRLTFFNGQSAYVMVARTQAYVSNVIPVVVENVAAFQPVIAQAINGSILSVTGTISADRRYVNLNMTPSVQTVNGFTEYRGAVDARGNPIPGSGQLQLPNLTTQEVACTVSVPDGGTLLLGGQRLAGETEREMGVPIISKIPVLNRAFTNRSLVRDEQTLLILVKPKIIIQREYEEAAFPP